MRTLLALIPLLSIAIAGSARADIAQRPFAESCTLERARAAGGIDCVECRSDAARAFECADRHGATLVQSCTRYEGAGFVQIWCENEVDVANGTAAPIALTPFEEGQRVGRRIGFACCPCSVLTIAAALLGAVLFFALRKRRS
jgi:hypothetical protein